MYVGLDLHKHYMQVAVQDEDGNLIMETQIKNTQDHRALQGFLERLDPDAEIAMESSSVWYSVYSHIRSAGFDVTLSNTLETKAISHARLKTDRVDAETLAHLKRSKLLSPCYVPSESDMAGRNLVRHRRYLVDSRTSLKNKIHAILLMNGIRTKHAGFTKRHVEELRRIRDYRIDAYLRTMETVNESLKEADKMIEKTVNDETRGNAKLLSSIPGVGYYSALVIASEIGDVSRFSDSHHLCSYAGLAPSTRSSGGKTRHGGITKRGNPLLRSVLSECVLSHRRIRKDGQLAEFHSRIARKKGNPKATVATASKLLRICYWLLVEQREYAEKMENHKPRSANKSRPAAVNTLAN